MSEVLSANARRPIRAVPERDIALSLVLEFAQSEWGQFSLLGFYDHDADFIKTLAERLHVKNDLAFINKLRRVVRTLARYRVLHSRMSSTHKEYIDEPSKQMNYWLRPGKAELIRKGKTDYTMAPEDETAFLLRHAYPKPDISEGTT